jgi:hypothetical protein
MALKDKPLISYSTWNTKRILVVCYQKQSRREISHSTVQIPVEKK